MRHMPFFLWLASAISGTAVFVGVISLEDFAHFGSFENVSSMALAIKLTLRQKAIWNAGLVFRCLTVRNTDHSVHLVRPTLYELIDQNALALVKIITTLLTVLPFCPFPPFTQDCTWGAVRYSTARSAHSLPMPFTYFNNLIYQFKLDICFC